MFYDEMAAMVQDLLQPDSAGGLGQGEIQIIRTTPVGIDPLHPETPVAPVRLVATVDQIGMPKAEYRTGETVITTDLAYMITPTVGFDPEPGDLVRVAGVDVGTVVHVERLGSLDVAIYWTVLANR
jgi:hypothetical protein